MKIKSSDSNNDDSDFLDIDLDLLRPSSQNKTDDQVQDNTKNIRKNSSKELRVNLIQAISSKDYKEVKRLCDLGAWSTIATKLPSGESAGFFEYALIHFTPELADALPKKITHIPDWLPDTADASYKNAAAVKWAVDAICSDSYNEGKLTGYAHKLGFIIGQLVQHEEGGEKLYSEDLINSWVYCFNRYKQYLKKENKNIFNDRTLIGLYENIFSMIYLYDKNNAMDFMVEHYELFESVFKDTATRPLAINFSKVSTFIDFFERLEKDNIKVNYKFSDFKNSLVELYKSESFDLLNSEKNTIFKAFPSLEKSVLSLKVIDPVQFKKQSQIQRYPFFNYGMYNWQQNSNKTDYFRIVRSGEQYKNDYPGLLFHALSNPIYSNLLRDALINKKYHEKVVSLMKENPSLILLTLCRENFYSKYIYSFFSENKEKFIGWKDDDGLSLSHYASVLSLLQSDHHRRKVWIQDAKFVTMLADIDPSGLMKPFHNGQTPFDFIENQDLVNKVTKKILKKDVKESGIKKSKNTKRIM